jgi:hypothetical protein
MIVGAHTIIYSQNPRADTAFLRDVLKLSYIELGEDRLIFGLPPAEVMVHSGDKNDVHEFYLMCSDVDALLAKMKAHKVECAPVRKADWGSMTSITLPGGGKLGIYQPHHPHPKPMRAKAAKKKKKKKKAKKKAKKAPKKVVKKAKKSSKKR